MGGIRPETSVRNAGNVRHVERGDRDVDLEDRRLTQAEAIESQSAAIDLHLLRDVNALTVLAVRHANAARREHAYQHAQQTAFYPCALYFGGFTTIYVTWLPCVAG